MGERDPRTRRTSGCRWDVPSSRREVRIVAAESINAGRALPEWVFPTVDGTALDPANVRRSLSLFLKKTGLRRTRFHDLRHSFASWLIANGESLAYARDQMGRSSIQITVDTSTGT